MTDFRDKRKFLYDPDDVGGTGGDETGAGDAATPPAATPPAIDLKSVSDSIRDAIKAARETPVATYVPPAPAAPDHRAALESEAAQVNARFDELVNAGKASEAMALRDQFNAKANRLLAQPAEDSAIVKTAVMLGERAARTEHKDVMAKWGDEVRRSVEAMPLEQRVLPDAWDRAVATVKTNHFQEILDEQVGVRVAEAKRQFIPPPVAGGSRGARQLTGAAATLSEEQVWGAEICGVSPEDYAKQLARETAFDALPFKERAKFTGYPVLDDPRGNSTVPKGSF